jgi:zinc finger BED domain-containing protein 1 (E3 SUMO-protein ligase ZBED1)
MGKRAKSIIWNYFEKQYNQYAMCLLCKKEYKTSGNTSNLHDHLKRYHKEELNNNNVNDSSDESDTNTASEARAKKIKKQKSIISFVRKTNLYNETDARKQKLDKLVAIMVAKDLQPFLIVHDNGFQDLVHTLDPKYKLPNKTTLRNKILPSLLTEVNAKLQEILNQTEYVSLTTDLWSSLAGEGYITITCHFILHEDIKTVVLETVQIEGSHTAELIEKHIKVNKNKN